MTDSLLGQIELLDTDYADILANSSKPAFELQLIKLGVDLTEARTKTKFIALVQDKRETLEELKALTAVWKEACHYEPNALAF
jgi:TPP-dependent trihydroxycyclohexane-1,2-dione (THcHDO) dehydratase